MNSPRAERIALAAIVAIIIAAAIWPCDGAHATTVEDALALAIGRTCVNEAGFNSPADCALIYQAAESHGETAGARLAWLARHSPRVNGDSEARPCRGGNCRWSRELSAAGHKPASWPTGTRWRPEAWARVLRLSERLVSGEETRRPCPVAIRSWGSRADLEGNRFGWRPVVCEGARNLGAR